LDLAEQLAVYCADGIRGGRVNEKHSGAHDVGQARASLGQRLRDDLEAAPKR
jgi:hypothetical protein